MSGSPDRTLRESIILLLGTTDGVTDIVGHRFFSGRAPQETKPPYMIVSMPTHSLVSHLRGVTALENGIIRFDLFGKMYLELDRLRDQIIAMMNQATEFASIHRFGTELYEDDVQLHHLVADFSVWHDRS